MIGDLLGVLAGVCIGLALVALLVLHAARTAGAPPRRHPELRYAARTAERAGIFWVVFRVLGGLFGRG